MTLGDFLKNKRKEKCLSQYELSKLSGVNITTISLIECNRINPQIKSLGKICKVLDCIDEIEKYL